MLEKVKWKKTHNAEKEVREVLPVTQDKEAQAHLLKYPELEGLTIWTFFQVICADVIKILVRETNRHANRDKSKANFIVTEE